jgi:flagellin FlaB
MIYSKNGYIFKLSIGSKCRGFEILWVKNLKLSLFLVVFPDFVKAVFHVVFSNVDRKTSPSRKLSGYADASIGVGSLIIFIAMLLVAGIAATVVVQTIDMMQQQAFETGRESIRDLVTGVDVVHVSGKVDGGESIALLAIFITPRSSFDNVDLMHTHVDIEDTRRRVILSYDGVHFNESLSGGLFDALDVDTLDSVSFGIIVIRDHDDSCTISSPVINEQDIVVLMVNASACFGDSGIGTRTEVKGHVYPECGLPGLISFTTPSVFTDSIVDLQ